MTSPLNLKHGLTCRHEASSMTLMNEGSNLSVAVDAHIHEVWVKVQIGRPIFLKEISKSVLKTSESAVNLKCFRHVCLLNSQIV